MITKEQILESINADDFVISASSTHHIMGGYKGHLLTEAQEKELAHLENKEKGLVFRMSKGQPTDKVNKITPKESERLEELMVKKSLSDNDKYMELALAEPSKYLSEGAKTQVKTWLGYQIFNDDLGRLKNKKNKYTDKGNTLEDVSIRLIGERLGLYLKNNQTSMVNGYSRGETDCPVPSKRLIIDAKTSWDSNTFDIFLEDTKKAYYWQGQTYIGLFDWAEHYIVAHTLVSATDDMIDSEIERICYHKGIERTEDLERRVIEAMTYDEDYPLDLRVKIFYFKRDDEEIAWIKRRVELCRAYAKELIQELKDRPVFEIDWE